MSFRLLIIEDELLIAAMTEQVVKNYGYEVVAISQNLEEALHAIEHLSFDLALVDINLGGGLEGLTAGRLLQQKDIPFLYLTSYESGEIIKQASETGPGNYLIKPYNPAQLLAALEVAIRNGQRNKKNILHLQDGAAIHKLPLNDIRYVQADNIHIDIFTTNQRLTLRMTLKSFRDQVPCELFVQTHRSYLVNKQHITRITASELWLGDEAVPIARGFKDAVFETVSSRAHH